VLLGFCAEEADFIRDEILGGSGVLVHCIAGERLLLSANELLASPLSPPSGDGYPHRLVLLCGLDESSQETLQGALHNAGCLPSLFAVLSREQAREPMWDLADRALAAHEVAHALRRPLRTHASAWRPADVRCVLNASLSAADEAAGLTTARGSLIVLDGLSDAPLSRALLEALTSSGFDESSPQPPGRSWERATRDAVGAAATWGLRGDALDELATAPAVLEMQSRLVALFGNAQLCHMPGDVMDPTAAALGGAAAPLVANAAVSGDAFAWHRDAQPALCDPATPWAQRFGLYCNGAADAPLMVSVVAYLNASWPDDADGETLFLDARDGTGILVRPRPGRVVIMHQDLVHRLSAPSAAAGRPRYSLVWKLLFMPRRRGEAASIHLPEWGPPTLFGPPMAAAAHF